MNNQSRPIVFGEVLYDCFPDGKQVLGGAPFNVAWHLQAFGLNPYLISRVGNDELGSSIKNAMLDWGMDVNGLQIDKTNPTGTVKISFKNNEPSYEIVNHRAWDYIEYKDISHIENGFLYHGTLATRNQTSRSTLDKIKKNSSFPIFIDVNLRLPWWDKSRVWEDMKNTEIVKINDVEIATMIEQEQVLDQQIESLLINSKIQTLVVTCGAKGAIAALRNGDRISVKPEHTDKLIDTVGAGDAFTSVFLLGTIKKWSLQHTMQRAQQFASHIVGIQGATVSDNSFYKSFISNWNL